MKTWEMIKELTENPQKEFIRPGKLLNFGTCFYLSKDNLNAEWQEVKHLVGWEEAREHMEKGGKARLNSCDYVIRENSNNYRTLWILGRTPYGDFMSTLQLPMLDSKEWELL